MKKLKLIIKELRISHWIKNLVIFLPLFFGGQLLAVEKFPGLILAFLAFSFSASIVYLINDLNDLAEDKKHEFKKKRPLASGELQTNVGLAAALVLALLTLVLIVFLNNWQFSAVVAAYLLANLTYTFRFKQEPILDIFFVAGMYLLRLAAGAAMTGIFISGWLFVTVFFGSLLLVLAKRYSEMRGNPTRHVLKFYTLEFLRSLLLVSSAVAVTGFTVYSINLGLTHIPSVIFFTFIIFRYLYVVETTQEGERPEVLLLKDPQILVAIAALFLSSLYLIYV